MKKKILIVAALIVAALLCTAVIVFMLPGVRIHGNYVRINLDQTCYIYNQRTGQFEADSTIVWKGAGSLSDDTTSPKTFSVAACPIPDDCVLSGDMALNGSSSLDCVVFAKRRTVEPNDDGSHSTNVLGYFASYDLDDKTTSVQIVTEDGQWLIALSGFESREAAENYLLTDGRHLLEHTHFHP